jgi:hypothetical protein
MKMLGFEPQFRPTQWRVVAVTALIGGILVAPLSAHCQVTRFEILGTAPAFEGKSFGNVGPYEKITARATIAVDPGDPRNAVIADLDKAPRNSAGRVEAVADVVLLRPADPTRGNGTLLVDILNRGRKLGPQLFDEASQPGASSLDKAADAGIGFIEREGYAVAWIGWQADLASQADQMALAAPVLRGVTGPSREEFIFDNTRSPATAALEWPIADPSSLSVTVRPRWDAQREKPAGLAIRAVGPQTTEIVRPALGYDASALYEVTYLAKDPTILGLGFAATRDVVSFLRRETGPTNPLAWNGHALVTHAIGFGVSQSGRFLRDFLYLGFNEDLSGAMTFDGLMPHVAGGRRMATNYRFGQPGRNPKHTQDPGWQADLFPFTYQTLYDPLSGRRDGLMQRCRLNATCPRVMQTDSEIEWWSSHASSVVTDVAGNHLDLANDVRVYLIAGTPHFSDPADVMRTYPVTALPVNPLHAGPPMRALLTAMRSWICDGVEPPSSRVPTKAAGTLVGASQAMPHDIPVLLYSGIYTGVTLNDNSVLPPKEIGRYPVYVPRLDGDGMSISGIRMLPIIVPRATYTGWNPRAEGYGKGALFPLLGGVVPFAATRADRDAARDPRPSLAERYPDNSAYVEAVRVAAGQMVAERFLLLEDAQRAIDAAEKDQLSKLHRP